MIDYLHSHNTGLPLLDAQWDFRRARRGYLAARIWGWVRGRRSCRHPRALTRSTTLAAGPSRLEVVPLRAIVGTLEPTASFDSDFRPASNALRERWERIALAHRKAMHYRPLSCADNRTATTSSTGATAFPSRERYRSATSTLGSQALGSSTQQPAQPFAKRSPPDPLKRRCSLCTANVEHPTAGRPHDRIHPFKPPACCDLIRDEGVGRSRGRATHPAG